MRGPAPTPTSILRKRGSWRANARKEEPTLPGLSDPPPAPDWLSAEAAKRWGDLAAEVTGMGVMAQVDTIALGMLAEAMADYFSASAKVKAKGFYARGDDSKPNPALAASRTCREQVIKICKEFGLTPSSRARVKVGSNQTQDDLTEKKKRFLESG